MNVIIIYVEANIPSTEKNAFDQMKKYYGTLCFAVTRLIEVKVKLADLKSYLQFNFSELNPQLEQAESVDQLMLTVKVNNTIINIVDHLQGIVDCFDIKEANDHITAYKVALEEFCDEIRLSVCCNEGFQFKAGLSPHLKCETVEFTLEWEPDEHSLSDIPMLLRKAFQDMAKKVQVIAIKKGNSIIVTCYAPRHIMDVLLMKAEESLHLLRGIGLIKFTIGYHTILDVGTRDKVRHQ